MYSTFIYMQLLSQTPAYWSKERDKSYKVSVITEKRIQLAFSLKKKKKS